MTDTGWAGKKAAKLCEQWFDTGARASWCPKMTNEFASALKGEHARSVRIVKEAAQFQFRETDTNEWVEGYEAACHDILTALQRGRGKGGVK